MYIHYYFVNFNANRSPADSLYSSQEKDLKCNFAAGESGSLINHVHEAIKNFENSATVSAHNEKVIPNASQLLFITNISTARLSILYTSPQSCQIIKCPLIHSPSAFKNTFHSATRINSTTQDRRFITKHLADHFLPLSSLFSACAQSGPARANLIKYLLASTLSAESRRSNLSDAQESLHATNKLMPVMVPSSLTG